MNKRFGWMALACVCALALSGCAAGSAAGEPQPMQTNSGASSAQQGQVNWPADKLESGEDGVPVLDVYVVDTERVERMDVERYLQGVLAGEMKNDWPQEALKAQAILARTFVLKFVSEKQSKYEGADISTDIEEAQAYDQSAINDRVRQAVQETRGLVLSAGGELPYAWFHAHSGGLTELAKPGLGWEKDEPGYTQVVKSNEPETVQNEKDAQELQDARTWQASFPYEEFEAACRELGVSVSLDSHPKLSIAERGDSGRAVSLLVNEQAVSATSLRIALGSTKMRSTLLSSLKAENGQVMMAGKGYGHGVGMSQWGAYGMAEQGKSAEEIVTHYFRGVTVEKIW